MRHEDSTEVDLIAIRDMVDSMPAPEVEGVRRRAYQQKGGLPVPRTREGRKRKRGSPHTEAQARRRQHLCLLRRGEASMNPLAIVVGLVLGAMLRRTFRKRG